MKKILLQFTTIAIILLLGACSNDEIFEKNDNNPVPGANRTLLITATMPGDKSDGPNTRVGLDQQLNNSIILTWEQTDELQLAFVKGAGETAIKIKGTAKVISISEDGKKAQFDILIPAEITDGQFDLYGVYGGGGLDDTDPTLVMLPESAGDAGTLTAIQTRKDVMLHFVSKNIQTINPQVSVVFKHLGSLFSINVKNYSTTSIDNLAEARLVGPEDGNWAYNAAIGGQSYDLITAQFQNQETAGNYISFKAAQSTLAIGESITFWGWYPPLPEAVWPELQLELRDATNTLITSTNSKPARTEATAAGQSYYLFGVLDGSQLNFTDESYAPPMGDNEYWVMPMGTLSTMLSDEQKSTITTMIIRGEINKADFEVLKKEIPNLTYLDLKNVTCEGNKIPDEAIGEWDNPNKTISSIILPESITTIGKSAFVNCSGLTGTLTIPKNVTTIDIFAFKECSGFNKLILPDGLTTIKEQAFSHCSGFKGSLNLPPGLTTIEYRTFFYCSGFESLILPTELTTIGNTAFYGCSGFKGALTIPDKVTTIELSAFYGCSGFDGLLTLSKQLTTIEGSAFQGCSKLTDHLTIPEGVTSIGSGAFNDCSGLTGSLTIPEGVTTIGSYAFSGCSGLTGKVVFPASLESIGGYGFNNCNKISAFRFPRSTPIRYTEGMLTSGKNIEVPSSAAATYKATDRWKNHPILGYFPIDGGLPGM